MCENTPCLGTPSDIKKLIDAGYADQLVRSKLHIGRMLTGGELGAVNAVQIRSREDGSCPFHIDGLCSLHKKGYKPLEGRLASHDTKEEYSRQDLKDVISSRDQRKRIDAIQKLLLSTNILVTMSWLSEGNDEDIKYVFDKIR